MTRKMMLRLALLIGVPICLFSHIDDFTGEWRGTGAGLTKVQIRLVDGQFWLHAFGACHPRDCDWGEVNAQAYAPNVAASVSDTAEAVSAQFVTSFSSRPRKNAIRRVFE